MANFLFALGEDGNEAATRCLQLAKSVHTKGYKVNIFFVDEASLGRREPVVKRKFYHER
jgi:sulfur relay (sulfurtransferase) complex TusBCD TusD component (DsrE family)